MADAGQASAATKHRVQFPSKIVRITHARTHSLAHELRRHVRGVACEQHTSHAPALRDQGVESINEAPEHFDLVVLDMLAQQRAHRGRVLHLPPGLARKQEKLEPVMAARLSRYTATAKMPTTTGFSPRKTPRRPGNAP